MPFSPCQLDQPTSQSVGLTLRFALALLERFKTIRSTPKSGGVKISDPLAYSLARLTPNPSTTPAKGIGKTAKVISKIESHSKRLSDPYATIHAKRRSYKQVRHNNRKLELAAADLMPGASLELTVAPYSRIDLYGNIAAKCERLRSEKLYCFSCKCVLSKRSAKAFRNAPHGKGFCPSCESSDVRRLDSTRKTRISVTEIF